MNLLNLLLVLLSAWLGGLAARRLGYPPVLGELAAGILLGPPLLGLLTGGPALDALAEVGILLMMLYIGMEVDPRELGRATYTGFLAAVGGFITPFVLCYGVVVWTGGTQIAALFVGMAAGVTALAAKSRILADMRLLDTRVAHVMMAGSLITDTFSLVVFAGIVGTVEAGGLQGMLLLVVTGKALLFFAGTTFLGLKVLPYLGSRLFGPGVLGRTAGFTLVLVVALGFAELAELAGLHGVLGTFMAGLFLRENALGRTLSKGILDLVRDASLGFLAPIFFVKAGFGVSLDVFTEDLGLLLGLVGLAMAGKVVGTTLFYLPTGLGWREGLVVGAGMNGRGVVEIIIAQIGLTMGLISQGIFSILVFMAIFTTLVTPVTLRWGVEWLRRRNELVRSEHRRSGVLVVGAGPTARALARVLARTQAVRVVDRNKERCLFAESDGLSVVCGSALEERVLEEAGAFDVQALVAVTPNAEVNALVAQLARSVFAVPEVLVVQTGDAAGHAELVEHVGAATLFGGPVALADWDYRIDHDLVERNGFPLTRAMTPAELFWMLQQHRDSLPLAVRRRDAYLPFHGGAELQAGDRVILVQECEAVDAPLDRFDRMAARCPILDMDREISMPAFFEIAAGTLAPLLEMPAEELARRFVSRETASSTVLLPGLAIPHVMVGGEERFEMLIARCREGIRFPAQREHVHAAFVLVGSEDQRNFHLRALSAIAQVVQAPDFDRDWLVARDPEALRRIVLNAVRRRMPDTNVL